MKVELHGGPGDGHTVEVEAGRESFLFEDELGFHFYHRQPDGRYVWLPASTLDAINFPFVQTDGSVLEVRIKAKRLPVAKPDEAIAVTMLTRLRAPKGALRWVKVLLAVARGQEGGA